MSPGARPSLARRATGAVAWRVFVSLSYTTGLTLLIPFVALRILPADLGRVPVATSPTLLWAAIALIVAAFLVRLLATRSLSGTLTALGWHTFVPGFIGLLTGLLGRDALLGRLQDTIPRFDEVRPAVEIYLDRAVPQVLYLTAGFFVAGVLLLVLGSRLAPRRGRAAG